MEFLLKKGANPNIRNNEFLTARDCAERKKEKLYYHHNFEYATQVQDYAWIIEEYERVNKLIELMGPLSQVEPPIVSDFKTLTKEGMEIPSLSALSTKELKQLSRTLEQSFLYKEPNTEITLPIDHQLTPPELIKTVLDKYPGMMIGECHESEAPKRFIIENIDFLAEQGVNVIFLEHLLIEECGENLETYLTASEDGPIPEPLKTKLHLQDYNRDLKDSPYNFTNLVIAVKQHNLNYPDKLLRIIPFDTKQSYSINSSNPVNNNRTQVGNYMAHIAIEKEKARFKESEPNQEFRFVGFVGETHTTTFNKAVGVANYQKVPGISLDQIDLKTRPSRAPMVTPDYRYWMYSQPNKEASYSSEKLIKHKQIINLLQYLDNMTVSIPDNFEARKPLATLRHEIMLSKYKIDEFNETKLGDYIKQALDLSPPTLKSKNGRYSLLIAKVDSILNANLTQTSEQLEEIRNIRNFLHCNPLSVRENSQEIKHITEIVKLYEAEIDKLCELRELSLKKYGQIGLLPPPEIIIEPHKCPNPVWAVAIVEALEGVLASSRELSELDFEMIDKKQEKILYPLYSISKEKRREILFLVNQFIMERFPQEKNQYSRYLDFQLSKQSDYYNDELIKEDINCLLDYNNQLKKLQALSNQAPPTQGHSPQSSFNREGEANETLKKCSFLKNNLIYSYNELAEAFPQLNWPRIDNLKFNDLTVHSHNNEFFLNLSVQNLQPTNNNNNELDTQVALPIPDLLIAALSELSQPQTVGNFLSSMPIGAIYCNHNNENSTMQIYIRHAEGVDLYSLTQTTTNTLVDQNNKPYENVNSFLSEAMSFYKLPGVYPISTIELVKHQMQAIASENLCDNAPRMG